MLQLTDAELEFLLMQPDVAVTLARFNRAAAYQTADQTRRMELLKRFRMFEKMERRDNRPVGR